MTLRAHVLEIIRVVSELSRLSVNRILISGFLLHSFLTYSLYNLIRVSADTPFQSLHFLIIIFCVFGFLVSLSLNLSIPQTQKWPITVMSATLDAPLLWSHVLAGATKKSTSTRQEYL